MTVSREAVLEIDSDRGVIYVHDALTGMTLLRICRLPTPIPNDFDEFLDITHMYGTNWEIRTNPFEWEYERFPNILGEDE